MVARGRTDRLSSCVYFLCAGNTPAILDERLSMICFSARRLPRLLMIVATSLLHASECGAEVIDFEDLSLSGPETFYNGNPGNPPVNVPIDGTFVSGAGTFNNTFTRFDFGTGPIDSWQGWAYSNVTDVATPGFGNQYAAYHLPSGGGAMSSSQYGVSFGDGATVQLSGGRRFQSFDITNTTYAALSMLNGDPFSKQFGGASGLDPDFLRLDVTGRRGGATGDVVFTTEFYLADYRFEDSAEDYIVDSWTTLDLSGLDWADTLEFSYASSDMSSFGINTPTFFAADNFRTTSVPEAGALPLLLAALLLMRRPWRRTLTRQAV